MKKTLFLFLGLIVSTVTFGQTTETIKKYHDPYTQTQVREVYSVIAGTLTKHGTYKSYDAKGHLTQSGSYSKGKQTGKWTTYYGAALASLRNDANNYLGKVKEIVHYKDGKRHGQRIAYTYPNGVKTIEYDRVYSEGEIIKETTYWENGAKKALVQLEGICTEWYENGQKSADYKLKNKEMDGELKTWYDDGSVMGTAMFVDGNPVGELFEYFKNGNVKIQKTFDENSIVIAEKGYSLNNKVLFERIASEDGYLDIDYDSLTGVKISEVTLKLLNEGRGFKMIRFGKARTYYPNGQLKSEGTNNGAKSGIWITYYENGVIQSKTTYKDDYYRDEPIRHGEASEYYPNGQVKSKGSYYIDKIKGLWYYYNEDGTIQYAEDDEQNTLGTRFRISKEEIERKLKKEEDEQLKKEIALKENEYQYLLKTANESFDVSTKPEVVIDGTIISKEKEIAKNKKSLYRAFKIVEESYSQNIEEADSYETKLELITSKVILLNRMIELFSEDTKELEKKLKKEKEVKVILSLLGL